MFLYQLPLTLTHSSSIVSREMVSVGSSMSTVTNGLTGLDWVVKVTGVIQRPPPPASCSDISCYSNDTEIRCMSHIYSECYIKFVNNLVFFFFFFFVVFQISTIKNLLPKQPKLPSLLSSIMGKKSI